MVQKNILFYIIENPGVTLSQIIKEMGFSKGTAIKYLRELSKRGIVFFKRVGRSKRYYVNVNNILGILEIFRYYVITGEKIFKRFCLDETTLKACDILVPEIRSVVFFGSGKRDIDIAFIFEKDPKDKKLLENLEKYLYLKNKRLEFTHVFPEDEVLLSEVLKGHPLPTYKDILFNGSVANFLRLKFGLNFRKNITFLEKYLKYKIFGEILGDDELLKKSEKIGRRLDWLREK